MATPQISETQAELALSELGLQLPTGVSLADVTRRANELRMGDGWPSVKHAVQDALLNLQTDLRQAAYAKARSEHEPTEGEGLHERALRVLAEGGRQTNYENYVEALQIAAEAEEAVGPHARANVVRAIDLARVSPAEFEALTGVSP